jgi:hypothetical protein
MIFELSAEDVNTQKLMSQFRWPFKTQIYIIHVKSPRLTIVDVASQFLKTLLLPVMQTHA